MTPTTGMLDQVTVLPQLSLLGLPILLLSASLVGGLSEIEYGWEESTNRKHLLHAGWRGRLNSFAKELNRYTP